MCQLPATPSHIITTDQQMLYFEHEVLARFNLSTQRLHVDLVSISKDPALLQSVTAVANAHFLHYTKMSSKDASLGQTRARATAVCMLRQQLVLERTSETRVSDIFTANVLLCILDGIMEPRDEGAATHCHFYGGRAILAQWRCLNQLLLIKRGMMALMLSIFATMDLTYALLSGQQPYFEKTLWMNFGNSDAWWGSLDLNDPFLEILSVLSQLAAHGHRVRETSEVIPIEEILSLQMALENTDRHSQALLQYTKSLSSSESATIDSTSGNLEHSWYMFCSAYRSAALIYMYRVLCNLEITHPLVQEATALGLKAICETEFAGKLSSCLLFPTLIVGCHTLTAASRHAIRENLKSTASYLAFGSTKVMADFLENVWSNPHDEFCWWDCFETLAKTTFLF
ncbi:MAG: hypothetical protein M1818_008181 [Claussenomyces sp. TS43310]|nr:MAG: hypothetical protein M1818_008181 [Claussenomyces sp. TS43310]